MKLTVEVDTVDILDSLESLTKEDLKKFIKHLDLRVADWDFTNDMYEWYKEQHEIYKMEEGDE